MQSTNKALFRTHNLLYIYIYIYISENKKAVFIKRVLSCLPNNKYSRKSGFLRVS